MSPLSNDIRRTQNASTIVVTSKVARPQAHLVSSHQPDTDESYECACHAVVRLSSANCTCPPLTSCPFYDDPRSLDTIMPTHKGMKSRGNFCGRHSKTSSFFPVVGPLLCSGLWGRCCDRPEHMNFPPSRAQQRHLKEPCPSPRFFFFFPFSFPLHAARLFCERRVEQQKHRQTYIGFILAFASSIHNTQQMFFLNPVVNKHTQLHLMNYTSIYIKRP